MRSLRAALVRIRSLVGKTRTDQDLTDEIEMHLQMHIDDNLRAGMTPEEARRQAIIALGGIDQTKEQYRDRRGIPILETLMQDFHYAARTMRKNPAFSAAAVMTLGLAIGANTAIFSFADALAFRPPDVPRPGEIVRIFSGTKDVPFGRVSYPDYLDFRSRNTTLSGLVAYDTEGVAMSRTRDETAALLGTLVVSGNYFSALGVEPTLGRGFRDDDDRVGATAVVVISHSLWERVFRSDPAVIGQQIIVAKRDFTVIGVAPAGFASTELLEIQPDLYVPIGMVNAVASTFPASLRENRSERWLVTLGRLKSGTTASAASAEMTTLARSLEQTYPDTNRQRTAVALPEVAAREKINQGNQQLGGLLLAIVGLVLLIACANVANLMLSHAAGRTKEIAVRLALGASRGRLIRQLLTESVLLASSGGVCGLLLAYGSARYLSIVGESIMSNMDMRLGLEFRLDERVLLFTLVTSLATSVVFGLAPALRSTRVDLVSALKTSAKSGSRRHRWLTTRGALIGSQVALSVVVLAVAGLSIRHFIDIRRADPGFQTDHVLLLSLDPGAAGYDAGGTRQFYDRILTQTKATAGVKAVGLAQSIPLSGINTGRTTSIIVDGYDMPRDQESLSIRSNVVDGGYWSAMRIPIMRGRAFDERDTTTSPRVVLVNETMARRYWPTRDAVGGTVRLESRSGLQLQVVGIAKDGKYLDIAEQQQPAIFMPFSQQNGQSWMTMVVLGTEDAASLAAPIRSELKLLDASIPAFNIRTLDSVYEARTIVPQRLISQIMVSVGLLGLVLATVGLYGVVAYLTTLRTREIGIRMALGADRRNVLLMVLRQAAGMVGAGLAVGLVLAFFLTPAFASAFNFVPRDATILAEVSLVLIAAALTASLIPARRAAMVSPTVALRDE